MTFLTVGLDFTDILYNNYYYLDIESIPYQTVFGYVIHVIVPKLQSKMFPFYFHMEIYERPLLCLHYQKLP